MSRATRDRLDKLERFYAERLAQNDPALAQRARDRLTERLAGIRQRLGIVTPEELPPDLTVARVALVRKILRAMLNKSMYGIEISAAELAAIETEAAAHNALTEQYQAAGLIVPAVVRV